MVGPWQGEASACVRPADRTILAVSPAFAQLVNARPGDLVDLPLDALLDLPSAPDAAAGEGLPRAIRALIRPGLGGGAGQAAEHRPARWRRPPSPPATDTPAPAIPVLAFFSQATAACGPVRLVHIHEAGTLLDAERQARDAETRERGVSRLCPWASLSVAPDGVIRTVNPAAMHLFGLPAVSLVGRRLADVLEQTVAEPIDTERFVRRAWQDRATSVCLNLRRPGRRRHPVELQTRTFWELPDPLLLIFGRSLAYERRLERQLAAIHRLSVLGRLFEGAAHDANNVLATILARTQVLLTGRAGVKSEATESLRVVERAAQDGARILRRAMDLARGRPRGTAAAVDLNAVVHDALAMCRPRLEEASRPTEIAAQAEDAASSVPVAVASAFIRTEVRLAQSAAILGEAGELRELLINLILNAIDAMPHGGLLRVSTAARAEAVELAVLDTGRGMDAAVKERMFDPFFTTKGIRGTGLGLTLVRQIASRHRATIEVQSEPGKGTLIRVLFPRSDPPAAAGEAPAPTDVAAHRDQWLSDAPPPEPTRGRILVVDDEAGVRQVAEDVLRQAGHEVRSAATARQALTACARRAFDCLLIDLNMPEINGRDFARQARRLDPHVALVRVSGWGESPEPVAGLFDLLLAKPFEIGDLLRVAADGVALARRRRETPR